MWCDLQGGRRDVTQQGDQGSACVTVRVTAAPTAPSQPWTMLGGDKPQCSVTAVHSSGCCTRTDYITFLMLQMKKKSPLNLRGVFSREDIRTVQSHKNKQLP